MENIFYGSEDHKGSPFLVYDMVTHIHTHTYIDEGGESLGSIVGGLGPRIRVILVLRECIWNAPAVSLFLPTFDDTGSLGSLPRQVVIPLFKWFHPG